MYTHVIEAKDIPEAWFKCVYDIFDDENALAEVWRIDKGSFAGRLRREFKSILIEIENPCDPDLSKRIPMIPEGKCIPNPIDPIIYPEIRCAKCCGVIQNFKMLDHKFLATPCNHEVTQKYYETYRPTCDQAVIKYFANYLFSDKLSKNEQYTYGSRILELVEVPSMIEKGGELVDNPIWRYLSINFKQYCAGEYCAVDEIILSLYPQYYYLCAYLKTNPKSNQVIMQIAKPSDDPLSDPPCLRHIDMQVKDGKLNWFIYFRCLVGETPVFVKIDGNLVRTNMADMYTYFLNGCKIEVPSVDENFNIIWGEVLNSEKGFKNNIIDIELFGGGKLSLTEDHRVVVLKNDEKVLVEAGDIKEGDFLLEPLSFSDIVEYSGNYIDLFELFGVRKDYYVKNLSISDFKMFKSQGIEYLDSWRDSKHIPLSVVLESYLKEIYGLEIGCQKIIFPRMFEISEEMAFFMGLWLADGWYNDKKNGLRLAIAHKKSHILKRVLVFLKEEFGYVPNIESRDGCDVLSISIKAFANLFEDLGFIHGATIKHIPKFIYGLSLDRLQLFFDGWISGDGGTTSSKDMSIDFSYLIKILGKNYSLYTEKEKKVYFKKENRTIISSKNYHIREFEGLKNSKIVDGLYKKKKVKGVSKINREGIVYDITVDTSSHLFFCGEVPVLVHNSWDLWGGLPENLCGFSMLMDQMCVDTNLEPGKFICHSKGLHLYEHSWSSALARLGRS